MLDASVEGNTVSHTRPLLFTGTRSDVIPLSRHMLDASVESHTVSHTTKLLFTGIRSSVTQLPRLVTCSRFARAAAPLTFATLDALTQCREMPLSPTMAP